MTQFPVSTSEEQTIHAALELSKNSWLLAIQVPGRDNLSLHPIKGGDAKGLMAKLDAARDRMVKLTGRTPTVTLCHEAGYMASGWRGSSNSAASSVWSWSRPACRSTAGLGASFGLIAAGSPGVPGRFSPPRLFRHKLRNYN